MCETRKLDHLRNRSILSRDPDLIARVSPRELFIIRTRVGSFLHISLALRRNVVSQYEFNAHSFLEIYPFWSCQSRAGNHFLKPIIRSLCSQSESSRQVYDKLISAQFCRE